MIGGKRALEAAYEKIQKAVDRTNLVRKVSSVLSVCIIIGLLAVYVPNIIAGAGKTGETISVMTESHMPFGKALYVAFLYGTFQLANVAVFVQHAKSFEKPKDAVKSMAIGGVVNAILMVMVVLGIMTVYLEPEMSRQSVPTLFMVQNGVGKRFMTPLISVLIILGAVSTAVNMVGRHGAEDMSWSGKENTADKTGTEKDSYKDADIGCTGMLCGGFWNCPVRTADIDSESVQHTGLPGNSGDTGSVYSTYGGYTDGYQE